MLSDLLSTADGLFCDPGEPRLTQSSSATAEPVVLVAAADAERRLAAYETDELPASEARWLFEIRGSAEATELRHDRSRPTAWCGAGYGNVA